ncbi:hypothetical protein K3495_g5143 [Podosphaera aphanis]|nr:hypothetical protein K3495_g5143 [Podosphaera aphanis]
MPGGHPPLPRGPPPTGPSNGSSAGIRRSSGRNTSGSSHYPPSVPSRPSGDVSSRNRPRSPGFQSRGINDNTYRHNYDRRSPSRSDSYRPSYDESRRDHSFRFGNESENLVRNHGFNFRCDPPSGLDFHQAERGPEPRSSMRRGERQRPNRGGHNYVQTSRVASEREFLRTNRAPTPKLMAGMDSENGNSVKFLPLEDLSDSDEAEMDLSDNDDENGGPESKKPRIDLHSSQSDLPHGKSELDIQNTANLISTKSVNDAQNINPPSQAQKTADNVPRWSNPDPYTALPPPDESQRKKKDVVKLIRKARVALEGENKPEASTDDFISFDFKDDVGMPPAVSISGAPSGPRGQRLHEERQLNQENLRNSGPIPEGPRAANGPSNNQSRGKWSQRNATGNPVNSHIDLTSDPDLGSRKRSVRDEIKEPPVLYHKGILPPADGKILRKWLPYDEASSCPWLIDHSATSNMGLWLHKEIMDFYHYAKPKDFEQTIRANLIDDLRRRVKRYDRSADILPFGSFPAGIYLPTADLDLVLVSDNYMQGGLPKFGRNHSQVRNFAYFLDQERVILRGSQECVLKAKVPLVKYIDSLTGLKVDISFENTTGLVANKTFRSWKEMFPAMPILVTLIKQFLTMRGLNEPVNGGIGGFSVTCLVVSLLQQMPQVQSRSMIPEHHLGEILMEFFDLYGNRFNTMTTAISLNPASYTKKTDINATYRKPMDKFSIIDPNDPTNDIAGGSKNTVTIKYAFQDAYRDLQRRMGELQNADPKDRRSQSILSCIIGGNYRSFEVQREHLAYIYNKSETTK